MSKMTKTQKKRLIQAIYSKTQKLYMESGVSDQTVTSKDMDAVFKMCQRWFKRVG